MAKSKKYLRAIEESGNQQEFVDYLLSVNSSVVNIYAARFCKKAKIKAVELTPDEEAEHIKDIIRIAKTPWLDKFGD